MAQEVRVCPRSRHHAGIISDGESPLQNEQLPDGWDSDGASGVVAVFPGWLLSIIYFLPRLVIYMLAALIRLFFKSVKRLTKGCKSTLLRIAIEPWR